VSARTKRARRTPGVLDPTFDPPAESSEPAEFEDSAPATPEHTAPITDRDYFDDPVPFHHGAELREREERMRRLEAARPRRRSRRLKARTGIIAAVGVVLVAGALSVLGRSGGRKATVGPSPQRSTGAAEPSAVAHPHVGLAQAVAVAAPRRKAGRRGSSHDRHRRRRSHSDAGTRAGEGRAEAPTESVSAPEIVEEEPTAEVVTAAPPAPASEPEPVTEPGPTTSEQTGVATEGEPDSPGDEATRQFGFGR
jgi:hypothetical protein